MMNTLITIGNKGEGLADTNYWDSDQAKRGMFFCLGMLVPQDF
jgi:hypothetical protein